MASSPVGLAARAVVQVVLLPKAIALSPARNDAEGLPGDRSSLGWVWASILGQDDCRQENTWPCWPRVVNCFLETQLKLRTPRVPGQHGKVPAAMGVHKALLSLC